MWAIKQGLMVTSFDAQVFSCPMVRRLSRYLSALLPLYGLAQWPDTLNVRHDFGNFNGPDAANSVQLHKTDAYLFVSTVDTGNGEDHSHWIGLTVFDQSGNVSQEISITPPLGYAQLGCTPHHGSCRTLDNGFAVLGGLVDTLPWGIHASLTRLNDQLIPLWTAIFPPDSGQFVPCQVIQTSDSGFALTGYVIGVGPSPGFIIKTDPAGNEEWRSLVGDPTKFHNSKSIVETPDHGFILAGHRRIVGCTNELWLLNVDSAGNNVWESMFPVSGKSLDALTIKPITSGGYAVCGTLDHLPSCGPFDYANYLARFNELGDTLWTLLIDDPSAEMENGWDVLQHPNGDLFVCGTWCETAPPFNTWGMIYRATLAGDSVWRYFYRFSDDSIPLAQGQLKSIILDHDSIGIICGGIAFPPWGGPYLHGQDNWLIRIDTNGCLIPGCNIVTGITGQYVDLGTAVTLIPNPANEQVSVQIALPVHHRLRDQLLLTIVSSDGRKVNDQMLPLLLSQTIVLDVRDLGPGLYYLHLSDGPTWLAGQKLIVE